MDKLSRIEILAREICEHEPDILKGIQLSMGRGERWVALRTSIMSTLIRKMSYSRTEARELVLSAIGGTAKRHTRKLESLLRKSPAPSPTSAVGLVLRSRARKHSDVFDGYLVDDEVYPTIRDVYDAFIPNENPFTYQNFKQRFLSKIQRYGLEEDRHCRISEKQTNDCFVRKKPKGGTDARRTPITLTMNDGTQYSYPNLLNLYRGIPELLGITDDDLVSTKQFSRNFDNNKETFRDGIDRFEEFEYFIWEEQLRNDLVSYSSQLLSCEELIAQVKCFEESHVCSSIWPRKKLVDRYQGNTTKIPFECSRVASHGVFWKSLAKKHQGCPACSKKESNSQRLVRQLVCFLLPDRKLLTNRRPEFLNGLELDISTLEDVPKIAIEVNGMQHYYRNTFFHKTDEEFDKLREDDAAKLRRCLRADVNLIVIDYTFFPRIWGGTCCSYDESVAALLERLLSELHEKTDEARLQTMKRRRLGQLVSEFRSTIE